jgi:creatinine amidohydrolase
MKNLWLYALAVIPALAGAQSTASADIVSTRDLDRINWMEFQEVVPGKIDTVLLPTGTLEPHGVINNGADNTAPAAMARVIALRTNAMVAPTLSYGITGSLEGYPGAFRISKETYAPFVREILEGLHKNGFRNIIILNGHGGGQTEVLKEVSAEVAIDKGIRTLVINWWSFASDVTQEVFGEDGGHAGWNETAFIQAIDPTLVHADRYDDSLAMAGGEWSATPFPASIVLYKEGEGYPKFDQATADEYFAKVTDKIAALIIEVRQKWDRAKL